SELRGGRAVAGALAQRRATVPVELVGTAFQQRVWQALMRIPPGQTRSYAEIAAELGQPRAVRAVARACASNRVAVLAPCHRAIRGDGSLGGYRWGLPRTRALPARGSGQATTRQGAARPACHRSPPGQRPRSGRWLPRWPRSIWSGARPTWRSVMAWKGFRPS